jgi:NAD(P)H-hydrate repair Nnr-like enzyme with NAD(P)H-hydrate dehydratase domain
VWRCVAGLRCVCGTVKEVSCAKVCLLRLGGESTAKQMLKHDSPLPVSESGGFAGACELCVNAAERSGGGMCRVACGW